MHHNGKIYNSKNIQQLLDKRYMNAQIRKNKVVATKVPTFTKQDQKVFEKSLLRVEVARKRRGQWVSTLVTVG